MDDAERLIRAYRVRPDQSVIRKLDILMDLERFSDPSVVSLLVQVVLDRDEPAEARLRAVRQLRDRSHTVDDPGPVADALGRVLGDRANLELRLQAALALADFTEVAGVIAVLGAVALDAGEPLDLRYSAFTSLERAGPSPQIGGLLHQLAGDEALGQSARALLARWRLA